MYWRLSQQFSKIVQLKRLMPQMLVGILLVSQLSGLSHQISHINDKSDIVCLQCISTPDQIYDNSVAPTIDAPFEFFLFDFSMEDIVILATEIHYSTRAPPFC